MRDRLIQAVGAALGSTVANAARAHGGDINEAYDVTLTDGRRVFVKTNASADPRMFPCEARGLDWLRTADAIRIPRVLAVSPAAGNSTPPAAVNRANAAAVNVANENETPFLVLERISSAPPARDFDEQLGRRLARLHRRGGAHETRFGFDEPNFIADLPQDNTPCDTWPDFYATRRLEPQLRAAIAHSHAPTRWARDFERLFARLPELTGPAEPPSRLHGDLWAGNVLADEHGAPCLIDPAVYAGHREVDLAMLRLFGGAGARCFAAYDEEWPLAPGHADRVRLYQLYPLLVHVNLFGGGYVQSVESALRAYL